jgi:hypothetical protein
MITHTTCKHSKKFHFNFLLTKGKDFPEYSSIMLMNGKEH